MRFTRSSLLRIVVLVVVLGLVACGNRSNQAGHTEGSMQLSMTDFRFNPNNITTSTGIEVTWVNLGEASHTVTSEDGTFDSGNIAPGESFSFVFEEPGTYTYFCQYHSDAGMRATITVR